MLIIQHLSDKQIGPTFRVASEGSKQVQEEEIESISQQPCPTFRVASEGSNQVREEEIESISCTVERGGWFTLLYPLTRSPRATHRHELDLTR